MRWWPIVLLAVLPALAQPHYLVPDSAAHVAWVRSLVYDRDIQFANDYARLGMIDREGDIAFGAPTARGRPGNPFGIGSALVWAAPVGTAAVAAAIAHAAGAAVATDGFGTLLRSRFNAARDGIRARRVLLLAALGIFYRTRCRQPTLVLWAALLALRCRIRAASA